MTYIKIFLIFSVLTFYVNASTDRSIYRKNYGTENKVALIIGNSNYDHFSSLKNTLNDAEDMRKILKDKGFDVLYLKDANLESMENMVEKFSMKLRKGGVGFFYYAGHGIEVEGKNYLVPVEAKISKKSKVKYRSLPIDMIIDEMEESRNRLNIVVLDSCRNDPFSRSGGGGLAQINNAKGMYIAFATAPGKVASDGGSGRNGLFTKHLITNINQSNITLDEVFNNTRASVYNESKSKQLPWTSSSVIGDFYFKLGEIERQSTTPVSLPTSTMTNNDKIELVRLRERIDTNEKNELVRLRQINKEKENLMLSLEREKEKALAAQNEREKEKALAAQKERIEENNKRIAQSKNNYQDRKGKVGLIETYKARLSYNDHTSSRGSKLTTVEAILRQDRANYHKFYKRDKDDSSDTFFTSTYNRSVLPRLLSNGQISNSVRRDILYGNPLVIVDIYNNHIDITMENEPIRREARRESGLIETYEARLGYNDHRSSRGAKLTTVAAILRQDRANYHKFHKRDRDDSGDTFFVSTHNRSILPRLLSNGQISSKMQRDILYGTPFVTVKIYNNYIEVE